MTVTDTAVVTCFFNFSNYLSPQRNLRRWKRQMDASRIPVFGVELVLDGQEAVSKGWNGWRQIAAGPMNILWQKEPALNLCVRFLPPQYTKVVVCDCDVFFDNPHWLAQTSAVLNLINACSPYRTAIWTDSAGRNELSRPSIGADPEGLIPSWRSHPGFAIAMTRDFWNNDGPGGMFPYYVVGNGDTALGAALCDVDPTKHCVRMFNVGSVLKGYLEWHAKVKDWNTGFYYVDGNCYHEYHGKLSDRKYYERLQWIEELAPETHLKFSKSGLLEWTDCAPKKMIASVAAYFGERKEDS